MLLLILDRKGGGRKAGKGIEEIEEGERERGRERERERTCA